jgi:hypothetical protein
MSPFTKNGPDHANALQASVFGRGEEEPRDPSEAPAIVTVGLVANSVPAFLLVRASWRLQWTLCMAVLDMLQELLLAVWVCGCVLVCGSR